jgi:hypothetical protein
MSGNEQSIVDIGEDLGILVSPKTVCWKAAEEYDRVIRVIKHPVKPEIMYYVHGSSVELGIVVNREWTAKLPYQWWGKAHGPSRDQVNLARAIVPPTYSFLRVTDNTCPPDDWIVSPITENLLSGLAQITPAPSKPIPQVPDYVEQFARFPEWRCKSIDRNAARSLAFDGDHFLMTLEAPAEATEEFYPIWRTGTFPKVRLKGIDFRVSGERDVYDPETQIMHVVSVDRTDLSIWML